MYLEPDDVLAVARAGDERGCTEALFTLGDRPEARWPQAREFLDAHGHDTTLGYVEEMSRLVVSETGLFPHANPGVMSRAEIRMLRPSNVSMGMMLENISPRLTEPGMPHYGSPDKEPHVRVATIEAAGHERVPFTSGILVGIGETNTEIVDSLFALASLHEAGRHIQEVIVQNFRAKADTRMRAHAEPIPAWFARVVAVARWILGPEMNIQVPPNLTERFETYLDCGSTTGVVCRRSRSTSSILRHPGHTSTNSPPGPRPRDTACCHVCLFIPSSCLTSGSTPDCGASSAGRQTTTDMPSPLDWKDQHDDHHFRPVPPGHRRQCDLGRHSQEGRDDGRRKSISRARRLFRKRQPRDCWSPPVLLLTPHQHL
jgi:7,8-didemethyl-8-hydroxy-5-deazariboflavin synthase CofG subunit